MGQKFSSIGDIVALDEMFQEITSKLSYPSGSLLKIAGRYLGNYGIEVTDENREEIEKRSLKNYFSCWGRAAKITLAKIKKATREAGFAVDNSNLNTHVGEVTVELLRRMAKQDKTRAFRVMDVGAGDGETTGGVLDAIANLNELELAERCEFTMLEPSPENSWNSVQNLRKHKIKANLTTVSGTNHNFINRLRKGDADVIISSAVFHHMIFPSYLHAIREGLADDGVLVIGDWYSSIFKYPAFVADILSDLDIDKARLTEFQLLFDCSDGDERRLARGMDPHEIITNYRMSRYIVALGQEFLEVSPENRDEFLEGHTSFEDRLEDLENAGFATDMKAITEQKHPAFTVQKNHKKPDFRDLESNVKLVDRKGAAKVLAVTKAAFKKPSKKEDTQGKPARAKVAA